MFVRTVFLVAALAAAPLAAAGAQTVSRAVSYADLNLASADGSAALQSRLEAAARAVCAPEDYRDLQQLSASAACTKNALAQADGAARTAVAAAQGASPVAAR